METTHRTGQLQRCAPPGRRDFTSFTLSPLLPTTTRNSKYCVNDLIHYDSATTSDGSRPPQIPSISCPIANPTLSKSRSAAHTRSSCLASTMNRFKPKFVRRSEAERQKVAQDFGQKQALEDAERAESSSAQCRAGTHGPHTKHSCPHLPCNYCKKEGYIATTKDRPALMHKEAILGTKKGYEGAHEDSDQTSLNDHKLTRRDSRWLPEGKGFSPHFHCPGMSSVDGETMEAEEVQVFQIPFCKLWSLLIIIPRDLPIQHRTSVFLT